MPIRTSSLGGRRDIVATSRIGQWFSMLLQGANLTGPSPRYSVSGILDLPFGQGPGHAGQHRSHRRHRPCKDGTYSHAKGHSGACSRHGGVAEWLDKQ
jgi:hypothetical protein